MDDGSDGVEEGQLRLLGRSPDGLGEARGGERTGRDDGRAALGQRRRPLAHQLDQRMGFDRGSDAGRGSVPVHRQRGAGRHAMLVRLREDQRSHRPHLGMEQADRVVLRIVRAEAVGADQLGKVAGVMGGRGLDAARFGEADRNARFGQLPRRLPKPTRPPPMMCTISVMMRCPLAEIGRKALPDEGRKATIYTIGYEGATQAELIAALLARASRN